MTLGLVGIALAACATSPKITSGQAATTTSAAPRASTEKGGKTTTTVVHNGIYPVGTTVTVPQEASGIATVLVSAVYPNAISTNQHDAPDPGTSYYVADATVCASSTGTNTGANPEAFSLLLSDGSTAPQGMASGPFSGPLSSLSQLGSNHSLAPGQCDRGWLLWDVPSGTTPNYVEFSGASGGSTTPDSVVKWPVGQLSVGES